MGKSRKRSGRTAARIARALLEGKTAVQACVEGGYAPATVRAKAFEIVRRPEVQSCLTHALEAQGVTVAKLAQTVKAGLEANVIAITKDGAVETGLPDHGTRLKAYDRAERAYGFGEAPQGKKSAKLTLADQLGRCIEVVLVDP